MAAFTEAWMRRKDDGLKRELQDIWTLVFGEPPAIEADSVLMARIIKDHLQPAPQPAPQPVPTTPPAP